MSNTHESEAARNRAPFAEGDIAILYDRRRRRYRVVLRAGGNYSSHLGGIFHDEIIGRTEGFLAVTSKGHRVTVLRPTFQESVYDIPRQSQVIYPKDLGALLMRLDLYPGANVVESGLGSGASAAAILRAIGPQGMLTTYENRDSILDAARDNIQQLSPGSTNHNIIVADVYETGFTERNVDRLLLDLPEPWHAVGYAAESLRTGGVIAIYLPTVLQVHHVTEVMTADPRWRLIETSELIERPWHVTEISVRPEHRMVAHTGFITTARRCELYEEAPSEVGADDIADDESEERSAE